MDSSQAERPGRRLRRPPAKSSIDSLRTVEFRTTLRGYHMDDVDEYLERVAVEAEALQEQMRLSAERVKQAARTQSLSLEQQLEQARKQVQQSAPATELVAARRRSLTTRFSARCCSPRSSSTRPAKRPKTRRMLS